MQATYGVADEIRAELARRRMSVESLATAVKIPGTDRTAISFRTLCRRLAEPGSFKLEELQAIAGYFGLTVADLVTPRVRAA
jgi:hypothetical protein